MTLRPWRRGPGRNPIPTRQHGEVALNSHLRLSYTDFARWVKFGLCLLPEIVQRPTQRAEGGLLAASLINTLVSTGQAATMSCFD